MRNYTKSKSAGFDLKLWYGFAKRFNIYLAKAGPDFLNKKKWGGWGGAGSKGRAAPIFFGSYLNFPPPNMRCTVY